MTAAVAGSEVADGNVSRAKGVGKGPAGYRYKGDSLTAVRLIGVTGWKINGLARVVQGWAKGAGKRRSRGMAP